MISRLPHADTLDEGTLDEGTRDLAEFPTPRTILLACAEEHGAPRRLKSLLRRHAIVLRTQGGEVCCDADGPLGALLDSQPIERVIVMAHTRCAGRGDGVDTEPVRSTASIGAFQRYAPAAHALAASYTAGRLTREHLSAKLDLLVHMANVEACPQAHAALHAGQLELVGVVWESARARIERFDGLRFVPMDDPELCRLIAGGTSNDRESRGFGGVSVPTVVAPSQPPRGEITGGMA